MKAENLSQSNETSSSKKGSDLFDEELFKEATCSKMEQVQIEGNRKMDFYNAI